MVKSHYVPQFYLKNFSIAGKADTVYVYRRDQQDSTPIRVNNIAAIKGFYSGISKETGERSDFIEGELSVLEGEAAPLINRIVTEAKALTFSWEEIETLSAFVAFLHVRGPSFRQRDINFKVGLLEGKLAEEYKDPELFREHMQKAGVTFDSEEEIEQMRKLYTDGISKHFTFKYGRQRQGYILKEMFESAAMLTVTIFNKKLEIIECADELFITSDNPLTLMQPVGMPLSEVRGFDNQIIVLPVSPKRCLVLDNGNRSKTMNVTGVDRQRVLNINGSTMFNAHREIYSNRNSKGIKKAFNKTKEGASEIPYLDGRELELLKKTVMP
jgi:Protein of unknown function (DUF4238)